MSWITETKLANGEWIPFTKDEDETPVQFLSQDLAWTDIEDYYTDAVGHSQDVIPRGDLRVRQV